MPGGSSVSRQARQKMQTLKVRMSQGKAKNDEYHLTALGARFANGALDFSCSAYSLCLDAEPEIKKSFDALSRFDQMANLPLK